MRITHIVDTFFGGGKERRCLQLIQGLNKEGYNDIQFIIINDGISYKGLEECNCKITVLDRKRRGLSTFSTLKELYRLINDFHPEVVQTWGFISSFLVAFIRPLIKFRFIASYVADVIKPPTISKWMSNAICKLTCSCIVGNSKAGLIAYGIPKSKAQLVYNGFNEERFKVKVDKSEKKHSLGISTKFVVAMFATFSRYKDYETYIEAAKLILSNSKEYTFLAVGSGPLWDEMKNKISTEESSFIRLLGHREDVDELLQICDLTILCTNPNINEGLSNSIMESMAFGVPVLATNGGGTPEIIEDGYNGYLIKEQTPIGVAKQFTNIMNDQEALQRSSINARNTIQEKFLLKRMTSDFIKLYSR